MEGTIMEEVAVLAVDAGGTSCRAVLCNREGEVLCYAQGGSCNYHSIGTEQATAILTSVFNLLTNKQALQVSCAVLGLAGLDTPRDQAVLTIVVQQALAAAQIVASQVIIDNDAMLTLKASVGKNNGVIIVAGTGSIACGLAQDGQEVRVGGWGYRVGDEGSGYFIGKAALSHVLRAYDGREAASGIAAAVLGEWGLTDAAELVQWIYSSQFSIQRTAALAPAILRLATAGDVQALKIIDHACRELGEMAVTVIRKLELWRRPFELLLCGGLLQNALLYEYLLELIRSQCTTVMLTAAQDQPICANLRYGLMLVGIHDAALLSGLSEQVNQAIVQAKL
jgi:N-acetylglucosamine kinase-like BadF-type ATPase